PPPSSRRSTSRRGSFPTAGPGRQAERFAKKRKAALVADRKEAAEPGGPSLSPVSLNGAACSAAAAKASALLVGPCSTLRRLTTQPNESTPEPEPTSRWYRAVNNGRMPERVKTASVRESRMIWGPGRSCPG